MLTVRADSQISGLGYSVSLLGREIDTSQKFSITNLSVFICTVPKYEVLQGQTVVNLRANLHTRRTRKLKLQRS